MDEFVDDVFPILSSPDLQRLIGFYRDVLGGRVHYQFPPEGDPVYVGVRFGRASLGLGQAPLDAPAQAAGRISLWVYATSCDEAVERVRSAGGQVVAEPEDQPWGERIARVLDPDGNEVIIGQRAKGD